MQCFKIATALFDRFPQLQIGVLRVQLPTTLPARAAEAARSALEEAHQNPASADFGAWHEAFRWFGSKPKKYRCAAEALLLRVQSGGSIPSILPLVDVYNAASIRSGFPIGGDDLSKVQGDIQLTFATGEETFVETSERSSTPRKGEVIYRDDAHVLCRRWNWRESAATILSENTRDLLLYIEALTPTPTFDATMSQLEAALQEVLGAASVQSAVLNAQASALQLNTMTLGVSDLVGEPPADRSPPPKAAKSGAQKGQKNAQKKRQNAKSGAFWADSMAEAILQHIEKNRSVLGPIVDKQGILVYDEKTPSGQIHIGSARGWILHDVIARALRQQGAPGTFVLSSDDMDPYDKPSAGLDRAQWDAHLGKPFRHIPSPVEGYEHYGDYYFRSCTELFDRFSIECGLESTGALYEDGSFDPSIQRALDQAEAIQKIYVEMYPNAAGSLRLPFNPLCEQCGRIGTTRAIAWDSKRQRIQYECRSDIKAYKDPATNEKAFIPGCGHQGERSPFAGGGKFPWKVEWAAKWITKGVIAEWAGKDHFSAGGARAAACRISTDVFQYPPPYPSQGHRTGAGYEFLQVGGQKMSTSKGSGAGFVDVADVLSPRMLRFLMIRSRPNQVIDFDPNRDADILNLYAKHDAAERAAWGVEEKQPEAVVQRLNRMHFYTYPDRGEHQAKPLPVRPSFRIVALAAQATDGDQEAVDTLRTMGHVPAERGDAEVRERVAESKQWLGSYAPDSRLRIELNEQVPSDLERSDREKAVFRELAEQLGSHVDGSVPLLDDTFKQHIFNTLRANDLNPKAFFRTAYLALLGREDGPALSPFLLSMGAKALPLLEQAGR